MSKLISMDKTYKTRGGRDVRVLCVDNLDKYLHPVVAVIGGEPHLYTEDGKFYLNRDNPLDLIEQPEEFSMWVEMFKSNGDVLSCSYETKDELILSIKTNEECKDREGYELLATKKITVAVGESCL